MRIELHDRMKNLAGARISLDHAHRPTAAVAIGPLNRRIPHIQRIGSFRQIFNDERIAKSSLLECLVPPQRTATRSRTHRLRDSTIEIKRNRLNRLTHRGARIFLLQPPAVNEVLTKRLFVCARKVVELLAEESHARKIRAP